MGIAVIDHQGLKILFECDTCDAVWESEEREEFDDAWSRAKADGWSVRKIVDEWLHGCPHCGAPT